MDRVCGGRANQTGWTGFTGASGRSRSSRLLLSSAFIGVHLRFHHPSPKSAAPPHPCPSVFICGSRPGTPAVFSIEWRSSECARPHLPPYSAAQPSARSTAIGPAHHSHPQTHRPRPTPRTTEKRRRQTKPNPEKPHLSQWTAIPYAVPVALNPTHHPIAPAPSVSSSAFIGVHRRFHHPSSKSPAPFHPCSSVVLICHFSSGWSLLSRKSASVRVTWVSMSA